MLESKAAPNKHKTTRAFGLIKSNGNPVDFVTDALTVFEMKNTATVDKRKLMKAMIKASE